MQLKNTWKNSENRIAVFAFFVAMVVACSPLITKLCINGYDMEYHLLRIESLKEAILIGRPFSRINVLFFGGAGYASSMFYPDFLLYIPAILRACGVGINASYHIFAATCFCLIYLTAYYCAKKMTGSVYASVMAAVFMVLSPYLLGDVLVRAAVGEYTAFIFLPFVICGVYNVIYEEMSRPQVLAIGFGGVLLCHANTMLFCLLFAAVAFLIKWKTFRNRKVLGRLFATAGLTAALTMNYWLPMLEMMFTTPLYVNDPWITLEQTALQFREVFSQNFPSLGFLLVVVALFRILVKKNPQNRALLGFADWLLIGGGIFAFLATDLVPWARLNAYLSFVQFPWRFFVPASAMLAFADAIILYCFIKASLEPLMQGSQRVICILVLVVAAALSFSFISKAEIRYYDFSDDYYTHKPFTANVIAGEWLPKTVKDRDLLVKESDVLRADTGEALPFARVKNTIEADLQKKCGYVDVPLLYYRGYAAVMTEETGAQTKLNVSAGENGLCRVETNNLTGKLRVRYEGTKLQHFAFAVSLLAAVGILAVALLHCRKETGGNETVNRTGNMKS